MSTAKASNLQVAVVEPEVSTGESGSIEALIIFQHGEDPELSLRPILGRSPLERHLYHLRELGIASVAVVCNGGIDFPRLQAEIRRVADRMVGDTLDVQIWNRLDPVRLTELSREFILLDGGSVFDPRLYEVVMETRGPIAVTDSSGGVEPGRDMEFIGIGCLDRGSLPALAHVPTDLTGYSTAELIDSADPERIAVSGMPDYLPGLRRHLRPFWRRIRGERDRVVAGRLILDSAQKGVLDIPARYLHPGPENLLTRLLSRTTITPNIITIVTGLVAFGATYLFATGSFGLGLVIAFLVNVLDGVDGKLARVRLEASRVGDKLDHILDVAFEFSWYVGLGVGLKAATGNSLPLTLGVALIGVMIMARAVSGVYRWLSGRQIHDHTAFDRGFRLVAGRRNIYTLILLAGLLAGSMESAFYATFGWGVVTVSVYLIRTLMALLNRRQAGASNRFDLRDR